MAQPRIDQTGFRRILTRAIVLPLIAMVALAGILLWQINTMLMAARAVEHSDRVITQTWQVEKLLLDLQTGVRGYLLTNNRELLEPYATASGSIDKEFDQLAALVTDNADQSASLVQIRTNYLQWKQRSDTILALKESGGDYQPLITAGVGAQLMDTIRGQLETFLATEQGLRDTRSQNARQTTQAVVFTSLAVVLIIGVALALFSRRQLLRLSQSYSQVIVIAQERADQLAEQRERLQVTLTSIGDAVIVTDTQGRVTFANPVAQALTGWSQLEAQNQPLETVFAIVNEDTRQTVENPVSKVIREGIVVGLANHTILIARDGAERPIDDSAAPIRDATGQIVGVVLVFRDIAERKIAEAALSASEERFRTLFENSPVGIGLARDGNLLYSNAAFLHMFGYTDTATLSGRPLTDVIAPALRAEIGERTLQRQRGDIQPSAYETVGIRKDGTEFPYAVEVGRLMLPDGPAAVAFLTDITERKRAEVALRASEQRYRDLADSMPLIVWIAGPDGAIEYFSQRWYDTTGQTAEQALGWGWAQAIHPEDQQHSADRWSESIRSGAPYEIEYRWRRADGSYRWYLGRALPVRDDKQQVAYWVGTGTDIDDQKHTEDQQRLLASASDLLVGTLDYETMLAQLARLAVPQLADWCAVHILEEDGTIRRLAIVHVDPAKEALARERPDRYSLDPGARHIVPQVLRTGLPEMYTDIPDNLLTNASRDVEHLKTLRALGFTSYMCLPLLARERTLGAITFVTAESGRHYGQAELELAEDLASRAAIAVDNARLYRDAQAAVRARDQFLSIASHELKTPLTSLMGYIELIQRRAQRDGVFAERDQRAIRVVGEQATRLNKLVGALLDLSRIETGQLSIERGLVDLNELARRLVEDTRPMLDERHTITFSGAQQASIILGDELRLEQVMQNLIQNAIKYSPNGGAIAVRVERDSDTARVIVSDHGMGIPASALPQLFRRFYRAPNADPRHISGMGIGLYVVKEIVELHGGAIEVTSQEGDGSTFTISLPLLADQPEGDR